MKWEGDIKMDLWGDILGVPGFRNSGVECSGSATAVSVKVTCLRRHHKLYGHVTVPTCYAKVYQLQ